MIYSGALSKSHVTRQWYLHTLRANLAAPRTGMVAHWRGLEWYLTEPHVVTLPYYRQSVFCGSRSILKSLVCPINNSGDIEMNRFRHFGLKLPIHAPFGEFLGKIFPIWCHRLSWPPKGPSLGGNTSFEPFSVRISATVRPGRRIEKNVLYFPYFGEAPAGPIQP